MTEFDESIALQRRGANEWIAMADPRREAINGMYGGWTATILINAVLQDAVDCGSASTLTVHFLKPIPPESRLLIRTRNLSTSRSLSVWQAGIEVLKPEQPLDGEEVESQNAAAIATVVLARRRESFGFTDMVMPEAPPPFELTKAHPPGRFGRRSLIRPVIGLTPFNMPDTRSVAWVRETSGRDLNHLLLTYLSDNYPPKTWSQRCEPSPYSTITLSVYFHATEQEVSDLGDNYVLIEAVGTRAESSTVGAHARIWSREGVLLLTTEQMGWYR